jgi:hypothetical protein
MEASDPSEDRTVVQDSSGNETVVMDSPPSGPGPAKAGVLARVLGVIGALVLAFAAAVAIVSMLDISSLTPCYDANRDPNFTGTDCFDGSSKRKLLTLALGFPGAALAVIAFVLTLVFVVRGRGLKQVAIAVAAGALLFGLSLIVGSTG